MPTAPGPSRKRIWSIWSGWFSAYSRNVSNPMTATPPAHARESRRVHKLDPGRQWSHSDAAAARKASAVFAFMVTKVG